MASKNRLQRLGRKAGGWLKSARRRATDPRTHRKIKHSLLKTGRVLKAAGSAGAAAGRAEMRGGKRRPAR
jgi:hypothetical protein